MAIYPPDVLNRAREQTTSLFPALIGKDELRPAIPRRVALQQSPPPLHRLALSVKDVWRQTVKDVLALDTDEQWDTQGAEKA